MQQTILLLLKCSATMNQQFCESSEITHVQNDRSNKTLERINLTSPRDI